MKGPRWIVAVLWTALVVGSTPVNGLDLEALQQRFAEAARAYDRKGLEQCLSLAARAGQKSEPSLLVLRGQCLYRLALIASLEGDAGQTRAQGEQSLVLFEQGSQDPPSFEEALLGHALTCQLLAGLDWTAGATFGPRVLDDLRQLKARAPKSYAVRYLDALSALEAPAFFGGDPRRAMAELQVLVAERPADEDAQISLAHSMDRSGLPSQAVRLLDSVLARNPRNLQALRLWDTLARAMAH